MFVTRHDNAPAIKQVAGESCQTRAIEEQAVYALPVGMRPPEPSLTAEAVVALVAQTADLLQQLGFRLFGYAGQPERLPPVASPCQDVEGVWRTETTYCQATLTGYPELGWAQFRLEAWRGGYRADTSHFFVHALSDVRFLLDNWCLFHAERVHIADKLIGQPLQ